MSLWQRRVGTPIIVTTLKTWQFDLMNDYNVVYTDGACSGNPGPGGWGAIVAIPGRVKELGDSVALTSNNKMELTACLEGLRLLSRKHAARETYVITDSTYVIRGITQWIHGWRKRGWKTSEGEPVSNQEIWMELAEVAAQFSQIHWRYVRGHTGVAGNERCDEIAVAFSKGDFVSLFNGPSDDYFFDVLTLPPEQPLPEMKSPNSAPKVVTYLSLVNGHVERHKTWADCEKKVKGISGARYKKVENEEQERQTLQSWGVSLKSE